MATSDISDCNYASIFYTNARSLVKQFKELQYLVHKNKYDIIAVTETWLSTNIVPAKYHLDGYQAFSNNREYSSGGLLYTSKRRIMLKLFQYVVHQLRLT